MKKPKLLDVGEAELAAVSCRLEQGRLEEADYPVLKAAIETLLYLRRLLERKDTAMQRVLRMLFGARTEKTSKVLPEKPPPAKAKSTTNKKRKGHGRRGAAAYWGAEKITVSHEGLSPGQSCPDCGNAKLYDTQRPAVLIRLCAQPPVAGKIFELQKLRCGLCGKLFSASAPQEAGQEKHDANLAPMLGLLRYGYGMPMNRLERMQEDFGVPLPAGTQWDLIRDHAEELSPVWEELLRQAAEGQVIYNDDTTVRILAVEKQIREAEDKEHPDGKGRTGLFTTGILSIQTDPSNPEMKDRTIALFFSGRDHAGENLQKVLDERPQQLPSPIQMCDGLSRNEPSSAETLMANCNAHARRGFVSAASSFPEQCRHVLETIQQIYRHENTTRAEGMSAAQRLQFHQQHSAHPMENLKQWMEQKIEDKEVEPNSSLGEAINYMLNRWEPLTLFLRRPGAPIDNNICERALKMSIRHRNNSLFYKTENGAHIGDLFMSLIHTCRFARVNPYDYLSHLRRHLQELREDPSQWMPWNYQVTAAALAGQ